MSPRVYYNEFDPAAAARLRELIANKLIAPGDVDDRSIEDVVPSDLRGYRQVHFFAGIGGWSYALRLAGWPDDQPVWTGSCPCQPFSSAGARAGFEDERHLWPAMQHLIAQCCPPVVFGEQVASKAADAWIDLVHADMEGMGYAFGCIPFPAAGIGSPQIRDRTYWLGHAYLARLEGLWHGHQAARGRFVAPRSAATAGESVWPADIHGDRCASTAVAGFHDAEHHAQPRGGAGGLADADGITCRQGSAIDRGRDSRGDARPWAGSGSGGVLGDTSERPGPVNGHWRAADWLACRDGKWRPVEPGSFPLAHGLPARVVRLRGYGNAIVPQAAAEFVRAYVEAVAAKLEEAA